MAPDGSITFLLLAAALYGSPGPATVSLAASGATSGLRRSLPFVFGMIAGFCVTVFLAVAGLGVLLSLHPAVFTVFRWLSFGFILYLAWRLAHLGLPGEADVDGAGRFSFFDAFVLNLLNPKAYIAALAVMAPFADPERGLLVQSLTFLALLLPLVTVINFSWCAAGSLLADRFRRRDSARWLQRLLAALLAGSAAWAVAAPF